MLVEDMLLVCSHSVTHFSPPPCVTLHSSHRYGYDSDFDKAYWIMRNSWGTTWGIAGYMHLERHDTDAANWCSLDISPLDGTGCDGGPGTLKVCGSCGVLYDVSYPIGGKLL